MVNDQEPRYRLVDADGNVVGSLFAESDGTLKLQEGTSGNDNELSFGTDGGLGVEQVSVDGQPISWGWELLDTVDVNGASVSSSLSNSEYGGLGGQLLLSVSLEADDTEPTLTAQLANDTSSSYNYIQRGGTTFSSTSGDTSFELYNATVIDRGFQGAWIISAPFQSRPTVSKLFASTSRSFFQHLIEGHISAPSGISSVQLSTGVSVSLRAELYGRSVR